MRPGIASIRPTPLRSAVRPFPILLAAALLGACDGSTALDPDISPEALAAGGGGAGAHAGGATDPEACRGVLGAVTVEQVSVPAGATCILQGTRVDGNVFVRRDATLEALGARIEGNVQAEDAAFVRTADGTVVDGDVQVKRRAFARIEDTTIGGNLQLEEWGASLEARRVVIDGDLQFKKADAAFVLETRIGGNLQMEENTGALEATANRVLGDAQFFKNRGGVSLFDNRVAQALQCGENVPAPTGSGNVAGEKEGQCRGL